MEFCHYFSTAKEVDLLLRNLEKICVSEKCVSLQLDYKCFFKERILKRFVISKIQNNTVFFFVFFSN